jgi:glycosyltransferase involved in cell wall biosynthesis
MIESKDISVVVQGAIDRELTSKCLRSIRKRLPDAEIILSTWEGSNTDGLDYDVLLLNKDPGSFKMSQFEANNIKRQIYSTSQGLNRATKKYSLKIRSDIKLTSSGFLSYFDKFNDYNENWHFLEKRIIIPSFVTRDPRIWESPMCPSDWCSFGLTEDMKKLWNIDFPTSEEEHWFNNHPRDEKVLYSYPVLESRYNPEQFIWINFIKKYKKELHCEHMFDVNEFSIEETLCSFANNLIILNPKQFGIKFLKQRRPGSDHWHIITYNEFLSIYNKYAQGHKIIFPINIERIRLFKFFKKSYKRLYKKAKSKNRLAKFFRKELKFYCPFLYYLLKPFILYLKHLEKKRSYIELLLNCKNKTPFMSIVIPAHGRIDFLQEVFDCLKQQTFNDMEVIVSDDSNKKSERKIIKEKLLEFHKTTGIDTKYIFSQKNLGQSKNTNQGLNHIRGSWCRILHSDDLIHPNLLQTEYNLINQNPDMIAILHDIFWFSEKKELENINPNDKKDIFALRDAKFIIDRALHTHCPIPSSLLFKTDMLKTIGFFDPSFKRACDWEFWSRIVIYAYKNNYKLMHAQTKQVFYRTHCGQNKNKILTKLSNYEEYRKIANYVCSKLASEEELIPILYNYKSLALIYRKNA